MNVRSAFVLASLLVLSSASLALADPPAPLPPPEPRDVPSVVREIDGGVRDIATQLRLAREHRDPRVALLSERLSQAHAASRRAHAVRAALAEATEPATRAARLTELRMLRARMRKLVDESAGDAPSRAPSGETRVSVIVDGALPSSEPARPASLQIVGRVEGAWHRSPRSLR